MNIDKKVVSMIGLSIFALFIFLMLSPTPSTSVLSGANDKKQDLKEANYSPTINLSSPSNDEGIVSKEKPHIETQSATIKTKEACKVVTEQEKLMNQGIIDDFSKEVVLISSNVHDYLKGLNEEELILDYESGNSSAAYVLGQNYVWSSYNTSWLNPTFTLGEIYTTNEQTPLNKEQLKAGREWLLKSALEGLTTALLELGGTYVIESSLREQQFNQSGKKLSTKQAAELALLETYALAYYRLYEEVALDVMQILGPDYSLYKDRIKSVKFENKELIYEKVNQDWIEKRAEKGEQKTVKWEIPQDFKDALEEELSWCRP